MLRRLIPTNIRFELRVDSDVYAIQGDAGQFEQILMNLVVNACDAMPTGGQLDVLVTNAELDELYVSSHVDACIGLHLLLTVRDSGCGMSAEVLNRMYEPFFTTKPPGKGTGLGLATVYAIVRRFGGHITAASSPGEGTEFKVYFPALRGHVEETRASTGNETVTSGDETILVCEDDEVIRGLECEILEDHGYSVLSAGDGRQGLEMARGCLDQIDLVVTDVVMPEINGPTLASELVALRPDLRILFVSGYAKDAVAQLGAPHDHGHFLPKPFTSRGFLKHIRAVLDQE
jgi:CheY-like chemotaxis protein